ncbi:TetR/AcrR family transcriptional regulator [Streptomyces sp. NPDC002132]|uniref:TetR/AcrR family transcriptional regulator n=1 Tax=unclassified Streptomyces TaxID=2593676 RepID=UPI003328D952
MGAELRADAARNRARILQVAREQLAAGDNSLQLNSIARLAGVGVGTVYRHFPNRHALVEALSVERFRELVQEARAAAAAEDALAGLHRLLRFALDRALDDADFAAVLESAGEAGAQTSELRAELDEAVAGLLDRARLTGAIRRGIEADDVRRLLCGVEHAVRSGDTAGPASVAAQPSIAAATDASLDGRTGVLIGPQARPVPVFRGATDPQVVENVLKLSRQLAPTHGGPGVQRGRTRPPHVPGPGPASPARASAAAACTRAMPR